MTPTSTKNPTTATSGQPGQLLRGCAGIADECVRGGCTAAGGNDGGTAAAHTSVGTGGPSVSAQADSGNQWSSPSRQTNVSRVITRSR